MGKTIQLEYLNTPENEDEIYNLIDDWDIVSSLRIKKILPRPAIEIKTKVKHDSDGNPYVVETSRHVADLSRGWRSFKDFTPGTRMGIINAIDQTRKKREQGKLKFWNPKETYSSIESSKSESSDSSYYD